MDKFYTKSKDEIEIMTECGQKLARVKKALFDKVTEGASSWDIEELAVKFIKEEGAEASLRKFPATLGQLALMSMPDLCMEFLKKKLCLKRAMLSVLT